jgi:hypothetical protein
MTASEAESYTGIGFRQVNRWGTRLKDVDAYRLALRKALQTVAMSRDPKMEPVGEIGRLNVCAECRRQWSRR